MFKPVKNKKVFEEILDQIKEMLINKDLQIGQKLPPEIKLSEQLGVSRASLREALRILDILGMIEAKTGEGTLLREARPDHLKKLITLIAVSESIDTDELYEARQIIEVEAAGLAALRRCEEDIVILENELITLEQTDNHDLSANSDYLFHQSIVKASKNKILQLMMGFTSDLLNEQIKNTRDYFGSSKIVMENFQNQHRKIFEAIKFKDAHVSREAMKEHFIYVRKQFRENH